MAKLLRWMVHTLEIFMWPQDHGFVPVDGDPFMELRMREDISPDGDYDETDMGYLKNFQEFEDAEPEKELSGCVRIEYTNSIRQEIPCYEEQLIDKPEELYYYLLEYFEQKEM